MILLSIINLPISNPTWIFFVVLIIILLAPLLLERLHIPQIVGMILAGVLIGPHGLNVLLRDSSFELFGQVGLYYIMFMAGLSMDTNALKHNRFQVITFGLLSFFIPFIIGEATARHLLNFSSEASILVACILASHTLVSYPIISRYGLSRHRGVTLSIAATMISLFLSLFVLAVLAGSFHDEGGIRLWGIILLKSVLFIATLLYCYPRIIRFFFRKFSDEILQYIFVLSMVFLSAAVSLALGLEGVLGAFLAGLIFNRYIPEAVPLMRHIDFVGNALFIPYFLIGVGMLINMPQLLSQPDSLLIVLILVTAALLTKWIACIAGTRMFRLGDDVLQMTTGLTTGHAAGALAMVMVGRQLILEDGTPLANDVVLNAMVMLILISCIFSAFITTSAAKRIVMEGVSDDEKLGEEDKILVALHNPETMDNLVNIALIMRPHRSTAPLVGVKLVIDAHDNERELSTARQMVKNAAQIAASAGVNMKKVVRSGINVTTALTCTMKDFEASEIIIGSHWEDGQPIFSFNDNLTDLLTRVSRQIIIVAQRRAVSTIRQIHVVVPPDADLEIGFGRWLMHVCRLARQLDCLITFYSTNTAWERISNICTTHYKTVHPAHAVFTSLEQLPTLKNSVHDDHLLVFISAREGSFSWQPAMQRIPEFIRNTFNECSTMLIYPDQYGIETRKAAFSTGFADHPSTMNKDLTKPLLK